jgi:hypothetical protein
LLDRDKDPGLLTLSLVSTIRRSIKSLLEESLEAPGIINDLLGGEIINVLLGGEIINDLLGGEIINDLLGGEIINVLLGDDSRDRSDTRAF